MANYTTNTSDKSKTTALLLCALGGYLGLHYFMLAELEKGCYFFAHLDYFVLAG